jgi:protein O-GlcNAc transferase
VAETAGDPLALLAAGRARLAAGETTNALILLRAACAALPGSGEAHFLLGAALHRLNQRPSALAAFERALALEPDNLQAAHASLAVLCELGRVDEAYARVAWLLLTHPHDPQLQYSAALVCESLGDSANALAHYDRALQLAPDHFHALMNRGVVLTRLGRPDDALANNRRLASEHPDRVESHFNLAETALAAGNYQEAVAHSGRALVLGPRHAGATLDLGLALAALGRLEEAQTELVKAKALGARITRSLPGGGREAADPAELHAGEIYLTQAYARLEACDWSEFDGLPTRFAQMIRDDRFGPLDSPPLGFRAMMLGIRPADQLRLGGQIARRWADVRAIQGPAPTASGDGRIRIGYVSSDFRDHPMGHVTAPLFERHDRTRFELFAYALSPDDGSEYRRRIVAACDHFTDVSGRGDDHAAQAIHDDAIDVLVNLNGYTTGHRTALFAMRPAPVQVSYFGFPATMGAPFMDYLIADRVVVPEAEAQWYVESLVWLPYCYFSADSAEAVPPAPERRDAGLPERGIVFCDFNQHAKITPELFAAWMRVLGQVPGSVLWLLSGDGDANLCRHATAAGIDPGRLIFASRLPRSRHLARLQLADLFVDTRPCNGHTTAADALRAGVPVLTCPADTFASRVAASLARAAALDDLVVRDLAEYEALAVALALDPVRLRALKEHLVSGLNRHPVFDVTARARELETSYAEMTDRHRRGLPPATLHVSTRS